VTEERDILWRLEGHISASSDVRLFTLSGV